MEIIKQYTLITFNGVKYAFTEEQLQAAKVVDKCMWISVNEQLPTDNTKVLALTKLGEIVLLFKDSNWYTIDILTQINGEYKSKQLFVDVRHWMPLP